MKHPLDSFEWLPSRTLTANAYNPSVVFSPEMRLLEESLWLRGWMQPLLVASGTLEIIDGFHRWRISMDSQRIRDRDAEEVPCCLLDLSRAEAMMETVRINRAKGTHVAVRLSDVVQELHQDLGVSTEEIMKGCGMDRDEVELLLAGTLLRTRNLASYKYSSAWIPIETRRQQAEEAFEREEEA